MYVQKKHPPFKCSTVSISLSCFFNDVFFFQTKPRYFFRIPLDPLPLDPAAGVENHRDPGENLTEGGIFD